jgi:shikimate dehydrogenase/3-dehydroquinate dehydratase type I
MQLMATILEASFDAALAAIAELPLDIDGVEIRFDAFTEPLTDGAMIGLRDAVPSLLIATRRSVPDHPQPHDPQFDRLALASRFDLVDVELTDDLDVASLADYAGRVVLSAHDFEGLPDFANLRRRFIGSSCAHLKIAATPHTFAETAEMLASLRVIEASIGSGQSVSVIGMGEPGLYSRIASPFLGSHFFFAAGSSTPGAPGQLPIGRALEIYGDAAARRSCGSTGDLVPLFAVVGNPAGHSVSPVIHNALFRERGIAAAYTIASIPSFDEILLPFAAGMDFAPRGLSITAPFKEEAFAFADGGEAVMMQNARACRSVNTLVRLVDPGSGEARIFAENTDVDAFVSALQSVRNAGSPPRAAVIGAGGTARSALVALRRIGAETTVYNRTLTRAEAVARELGAVAARMEDLGDARASIVINTLSGAVESGLPRHLLNPSTLYVDVDYSGGRAQQIEEARAAGATVVDGFAIVEAQAVRQNELFVSSLATGVGGRGREPVRRGGEFR